MRERIPYVKVGARGEKGDMPVGSRGRWGPSPAPAPVSVQEVDPARAWPQQTTAATPCESNSAQIACRFHVPCPRSAQACQRSRRNRMEHGRTNAHELSIRGHGMLTGISSRGRRSHTRSLGHQAATSCHTSRLSTCKQHARMSVVTMCALKHTS